MYLFTTTVYVSPSSSTMKAEKGMVERPTSGDNRGVALKCGGVLGTVTEKAAVAFTGPLESARNVTLKLYRPRALLPAVPEIVLVAALYTSQEGNPAVDKTPAVGIKYDDRFKANG